MKVTVTRSGGFAGIARHWHVFVEEEPDEEWWLRLLRQLPWDDMAREPAQPDRYLYRITFQPRNTSQNDSREAPELRALPVSEPREVVIPEQRLTGPWRELVDRVRERDERERELHPAHPPAHDR